METRILAIFTRTPLHVGAGNSVGAVDSPIMRERHTRIPVIPGSSIKGVISDLWNEDCEKDKRGNNVRKKDSQAEMLFGSQDDKNAKAGSLLIGEAKALLFPVRSAKGSFSWITSPLALARLKRDAGLKIADVLIEGMNCHGGATVTLEQNVILEEYSLTSVQTACKEMEKELVKLIPDEMKSLAEGRITIVSDEMFSYFCENACEVVTRIRVNDETGTVDKGALFNQEQVPSETLFYSVIAQKSGDAINSLKGKLESCKNIIQIGGNETIGLGYCTITVEG
ncbi:MAG: type III-B CRISPR module RAMP protein Cmr4 [Victivallales bacterium]